jgi:hypothetical protein
MNDFSTTFTVGQSPEEVFAAINDVRGWWTGDIGGSAGSVGDEFTYRYEDVHRSTQRVVELVEGRKVVWLVTDAHLSFTEDAGEWKGTEIVFDVSRKGDETQVVFTHVGLAPSIECYGSCSDAWGYYVNTSLRGRIIAGPA